MHTLQGFCWPNFVTGHSGLKCTRDINNSYQYIEKLSWSLKMFRTFRILIGLCPEFWVNENPWLSHHIEGMHIFSVKCSLCCCFLFHLIILFAYSCYLYFDKYFFIMMFTLLFISMKYIGTMLSVFQRHNCICQVIIWTPEGPISYASESLIVIFLPWYNCCVYVLNGNKMLLNWIELNWTNAGLLPIGPLGTNVSEILIKIQNFPFTKMHMKISSAEWWPFCPGEMG